MFNIQIKGGKTVGNLDVEKYVINKEMMQDTQKVLFDFVTDCVAKFKDQNITETLPL